MAISANSRVDDKQKEEKKREKSAFLKASEDVFEEYGDFLREVGRL